MEAILWKLCIGAPWRDIPKEFCPWKTAFNRFDRWSQKGLWEIFLAYENTLIKNGYSSMEVMYGVINMQVALGTVLTEQLDKALAETRQKYTYVWTRMEIRLILKSLGVTCTTVKLRTT